MPGCERIFLAGCQKTELAQVRETRPFMGTAVEIALEGTDDARRRRAMDDAYREMSGRTPGLDGLIMDREGSMRVSSGLGKYLRFPEPPGSHPELKMYVARLVWVRRAAGMFDPAVR